MDPVQNANPKYAPSDLPQHGEDLSRTAHLPPAQNTTPRKPKVDKPIVQKLTVIEDPTPKIMDGPAPVTSPDQPTTVPKADKSKS